MAFGELGPRATEFAYQAGVAAARAKRARQPIPPCPWSGDDPSLTKRRLAGAWADGFLANTPSFQGS